MKLIDRALQQVKLQSHEDNVIWDTNPKRLTCVIVEPRIHPNLRGVLYNIANVYANLNVGLTIHHSKENMMLVEDIIQKWKGVELICLEKNKYTKKEYSHLLTSPFFYERVKSSHLLIFQTDSCIFRQIPDEYFEYDYVGAVWGKQCGNGCGNGGFSLRRKDAMIHACNNTIHIRHPEDIFFAHTKGLKLPEKHLQQMFSVEMIDHPNPVGCHSKMRMHLYKKFLDKQSK